MKVIAIALTLLLAACTPVSRGLCRSRSGRSIHSGSAARYESALGGYVSRRPVEPKPWREQNERVTPRPER